MAHDIHVHDTPTDTKAAFTGLIVGLIALFIIVRTIVYFTNKHYVEEKTHAEATK
jgi:hypothetical protein